MREDWAEVVIDQLIDESGVFRDGDWVEKKDQDPQGGVRLIQLSDIGDGYFRDRSNKFLTKEKAVELRSTYLELGDILLARMPEPLGRCTIFPFEGKNRFITAVDVAIIRVAPNRIDPRFLVHIINSPHSRKKIEALQSGTTRKRISRKNLSTIKFPLPPLPEQRAIVSKIEQLFSELDNGIANLKTAQQQLKVYRHCVLSSAMEGEPDTPIYNVVNSLSQGWSPKCINRNSVDSEEWAVIKTSAIQHGEFLPFENKILPTELEPRKQHEIQEGDILITRAGPRVRVGVCCLVRKTRKRLINCDKVYLLKLNRELILPEYFEALMNAPEYLKQIEKIKTGSSDSGLNLTQNRFKQLELTLPSLPRQHQIVQEIESRLSVCDKLEESIAQSLQKAEALRQSILKKAFEGRLLTTQELAACKKEKDWEPAGELLETVKKERNEKR